MTISHILSSPCFWCVALVISESCSLWLGTAGNPGIGGSNQFPRRRLASMYTLSSSRTRPRCSVMGRSRVCWVSAAHWSVEGDRQNVDSSCICSHVWHRFVSSQSGENTHLPETGPPTCAGRGARLPMVGNPQKKGQETSASTLARAVRGASQIVRFCDVEATHFASLDVRRVTESEGYALDAFSSDVRLVNVWRPQSQRLQFSNVSRGRS